LRLLRDMTLFIGIFSPRILTKGGAAAACRNAAQILRPAPWPLQSNKGLTNVKRLYSLCSVVRPIPYPRPILWRGIRSIETRRFYSGGRIITEYEDLPTDYRDSVGLLFREADLTHAETKEVFGSSSRLRVKEANTLLRILHGRRVAGTLDDPVYFRHTSSFTAAEKEQALEYLRKTVPVDEVFNAGLRAEDELAQLEHGGEEPDPPTSTATDAEEGSRQSQEEKRKPVYKADPVYGHSYIEEIRSRNIARREAQEAEERRLKEIREKAELELAQQNGQRGPMELESRREPSARMQIWTQNASSQMKEPPKMTFWERAMPSTIMATVIIGFCVILSMYYKPPRAGERLFPDVPPAAATIFALIGLNLLVHAAWKVPPLWRVLNKYFIMVHGLPQPLSVTASNFTHSSIYHLLSNMVALWFFGTRLHDDVGRGTFLAVYLSSGVVGSVGTFIWYTARGILTASSVGASGAVYGIMAAYFWLHRLDTFKIFGLPPEPLEGVNGLGFLGLVLGLHIWYLFFSKVSGGVDYFAHVAGMMTGWAWAVDIDRKKAAERRRDQRLTVDLWTRASQPKKVDAEKPASTE
jgi:rhomboid-like protein